MYAYIVYKAPKVADSHMTSPEIISVSCLLYALLYLFLPFSPYLPITESLR